MSYTTTAKRQIDHLITELKSAGIWSKLDWYGNALWATTEHDALLNWTNPAQTLTKVGGASWVPGQGLKGVNPMTDAGRYKSGWNVGDGPHSTRHVVRDVLQDHVHRCAAGQHAADGAV